MFDVLKGGKSGVTTAWCYDCSLTMSDTRQCGKLLVTRQNIGHDFTILWNMNDWNDQNELNIPQKEFSRKVTYVVIWFLQKKWGKKPAGTRTYCSGSHN